jgi:hypothetical protein
VALYSLLDAGVGSFHVFTLTVGDENVGGGGVYPIYQYVNSLLDLSDVDIDIRRG